MSAYDQTKGELCDKCGWAMKFPGEPCRCELERENAALREERGLWEAKCHELIAPHYILNPDLRAAKFREALRFHPVLNLKARAIIDAARKEAQP